MTLFDEIPLDNRAQSRLIKEMVFVGNWAGAWRSVTGAPKVTPGSLREISQVEGYYQDRANPHAGCHPADTRAGIRGLRGSGEGCCNRSNSVLRRFIRTTPHPYAISPKLLSTPTSRPIEAFLPFLERRGLIEICCVARA